MGGDHAGSHEELLPSPVPAASLLLTWQDLGLESPNWFGYSDYGEMVKVMDTYVQGVEDTGGEAVVKVPPKPAKEVPRGLEEVAMYLYKVSWQGWLVRAGRTVCRHTSQW